MTTPPWFLGTAPALIPRALFIASVLGIGSGHAQAPEEDAIRGDRVVRELRRHHRSLTRLAAEAANSDIAVSRLHREVDGILDYDEITRRAMVVHWDELDPGRRRTVARLLRDLVRASYADHLASLRDVDVVLIDRRPRGQGWVVRGRAIPPGAPPVNLAYEVTIDHLDRVRLSNVVYDGHDLLRHYRRQFDQVMRQEGVDGLIARMRARLGERGS